jgi:hypothetical protein
MPPNKILFEPEVTLPMAAAIGRPLQERDAIETLDDFVQDLRIELAHIIDIARVNIRVTSNYQKRHYDSNAKALKYKVGQCV